MVRSDPGQKPGLSFTAGETAALDSSFLRMRRSSMKLSAVIVEITDANKMSTSVHGARAPLPLMKHQFIESSWLQTSFRILLLYSVT